MFFTCPWFCLLFVPVILAAWWAYTHPAMFAVHWPGLRFLNQRPNLPHTGQKARRFTWPWLMVFAGAVCLILALSGFHITKPAPSRNIGLYVYPSAELGSEGVKQMRGAIKAFKTRLDKNDIVTIVNPLVGGAADIQLTAQPMARCEFVRDKKYDQAVYFVPAGKKINVQGLDHVVEISCFPPPVHVRKAGFQKLPRGKLQIYLNLKRTDTRTPSTTLLGIKINDDGFSGELEIPVTNLIIKNMKEVGSCAVAFDFAPSSSCRSYAVEIDKQKVFYFVLPIQAVKKVFLSGRLDKNIQKYLQADPKFTQTNDPAQADLIIATDAESSNTKPAIIINPPKLPLGFLNSKPALENILLDKAQIIESPITKGLDLSRTAVRGYTPWEILAEGDILKLADYDGYGVLFAQMRGQVISRVYIPFDIFPTNTTLTQNEAFAVLLANSLRTLAGDEYKAQPHFFETSAGSDIYAKGRRIYPVADEFGGGIFLDINSGNTKALSFVDLQYNRASKSITESIDSIKLPEPAMRGESEASFSWWLAVGMVLCLAGWILRR